MKNFLLFLSLLVASISLYALDAPNIYLPSNGSVGNYTSKPIQCYKVGTITNFANYTFEMDTTPTFDSPLYSSRVGDGYNSSYSYVYLYNTGLLYGETYYWRVQVTDGVETSAWSATWSFSTLDQVTLYYPYNNSVDQQTTRMIYTYIETNNTDYTNYEFEMDTTPTFDSPLNSVRVGEAYNSSYGYVYVNNSGLLYGKTYYWRARVHNASDTSSWSATWNFTTIDQLTLYYPYNNSVDQQTTRMIYTYIETSNTNYLNYEFEMDTTPNFDSPLNSIRAGSGYNSSYDYVYVNNVGLSYGTTYYWRARVHNASDTSSWSATWNFTTLDQLTLYYPSNNSVNQPTERSIRAYIESSNTDYTNYEFEMDTTPDFNSSLYSLRDGEGYNSSYDYVYVNNTDLLYGTTYYWRARVHNAADTSVWSATWNFTTIDQITLYYPSNNATNQPTERSIRAYIEEFNTDFLNYEFEMDTTPAFDSPLYSLRDGEGYNSSYDYAYVNNTNLLYGTTYYWRARVHNAADTSQWSVTWNFTTINQITLYYPSNNATNQPTERSIRAYIEEFNTNFLNYEFEMDTTPDFDSPLYSLRDGEGYNSSYDYVYVNNTDLLYGTKYYWRARVHNAADTSQWSVIWNFTTLDQITLYYPGNNSINVVINQSIRAYIEEFNTDFLNYEFEMDTTPDFDSPLYSIRDGEGYNSSYNYIYVNNNDTLLYGTKYYWRARVHNAIDTSLWSVTWNFTTAYELTEAPILDSPADDSLDVPYTSTYLTWNQSTGATSYQYEYSTDASFNTGVYSGYTSLTYKSISNLQPLTVYYWRVRGMNNSGSSPWSTIWTFTTQSAPLVAPTLVSPANNTIGIIPDEVTLDWESVFGATEYTYEISPDINFGFAVTSITVNETQATLLGLESSSDYYWHVKSTDGVTESDWSATWKFTTTFGINVNEIENQEFKIYPNPTTGIVIIEGDDAINYEIVDITGHIIYSNNNNSNKEQIDLRNYGKGIYFVNIYNDKSKIVKKLVVK